MVAKMVGELQRFLTNKTSNVGIIPKHQLPLKTDPTTVTNPKAHKNNQQKIIYIISEESYQIQIDYLPNPHSNPTKIQVIQ